MIRQLTNVYASLILIVDTVESLLLGLTECIVETIRSE